MSRLLKTVEKMLRLPPEMRFEDVIMVLQEFGWSETNRYGSHFIYTKENHPPIPIAHHQKKVKRGYIKEIIELLDLEVWYEKNSH
jgi:predicted RNA binding protein YcfA (HicA-like mRNA interferase family)